MVRVKYRYLALRIYSQSVSIFENDIQEISKGLEVYPQELEIRDTLYKIVYTYFGNFYLADVQNCYKLINYFKCSNVAIIRVPRIVVPELKKILAKEFKKDEIKNFEAIQNQATGKFKFKLIFISGTIKALTKKIINILKMEKQEVQKMVSF